MLTGVVAEEVKIELRRRSNAKVFGAKDESTKNY